MCVCVLNMRGQKNASMHTYLRNLEYGLDYLGATVRDAVKPVHPTPLGTDHINGGHPVGTTVTDSGVHTSGADVPGNAFDKISSTVLHSMNDKSVPCCSHIVMGNESSLDSTDTSETIGTICYATKHGALGVLVAEKIEIFCSLYGGTITSDCPSVASALLQKLPLLQQQLVVDAIENWTGKFLATWWFVPVGHVCAHVYVLTYG